MRLRVRGHTCEATTLLRQTDTRASCYATRDCTSKHKNTSSPTYTRQKKEKVKRRALSRGTLTARRRVLSACTSGWMMRTRADRHTTVWTDHFQPWCARLKFPRSCPRPCSMVLDGTWTKFLITHTAMSLLIGMYASADDPVPVRMCTTKHMHRVSCMRTCCTHVLLAASACGLRLCSAVYLMCIYMCLSVLRVRYIFVPCV
jgi:hypothetical protein